MLLTVVLLACVALIVCEKFAKENVRIPGGDIQNVANIKFLKDGPKGSKLYLVEAPDSVYGQTGPLLLDLTKSTSYNQGYDTGYLLAQEFIENYQSLMKSLFGESKSLPLKVKALDTFLSWQWDNYLSKQLPQEYVDEIQGLSDGGKAAKAKSNDIGKIATWGITLANFPGTLSNIKYILLDEFTNDFHSKESLENALKSENLSLAVLYEVLSELEERWKGVTCSMFGVWGSRTQDGTLFTGRNLDWFKDSGISNHKLITIHHPPSGFAHATLGWAGIWGSITGISAQGITAHEANLESDDITFRGFPWVLRLRHIMAYTTTLSEAIQVWKATNNTVGFNHGFGSAKTGQAVVMETMKGNTAIFSDNDPREKDVTVTNKNVTYSIGESRSEAVYRTNHGYDEYTIKHYLWNETDYFTNSIARYMIFPQMFDYYNEETTKITYREAVNITALVGDKGDSLYSCVPPYAAGSNILSVTYDPAALVAYASWESGNQDTWTPAACGTYLVLNLKPFLL